MFVIIVIMYPVRDGGGMGGGIIEMLFTILE